MEASPHQMGEQAGQLVTSLVMLSKLPFSVSSRFRPLSNDAIEEDADEPKEASHLDYKYLKSYEGPLTKGGGSNLRSRK